jgi:hypothetical protein
VCSSDLIEQLIDACGGLNRPRTLGLTTFLKERHAIPLPQG